LEPPWQSSAADRDYEVKDLRREAGASGSAEVGAARCSLAAIDDIGAALQADVDALPRVM